MKFVNAIALACAAGYANAFTFDDVKECAANKDFTPIIEEVHETLNGMVEKMDDWHSENVEPFFADLKDKDFVADAKDWWENFHPTTRHDANRALKKTLRPIKKLSKHSDYIARQSHHRVRTMRAQHGRPPIPEVHEIHSLTGSQTLKGFDEYDGLENAYTILISFVSGFIYTPGETGSCSESIFTYLGAWLNSIDVAAKIYLPYNWPNIQVVLQDIIASGSSVIITCDANDLFSTLTHIITVEGVSELGGRVAASAPFELIQMIDYLGDNTVSPVVKSKSVGKYVSILLNFTIN